MSEQPISVEPDEPANDAELTVNDTPEGEPIEIEGTTVPVLEETDDVGESEDSTFDPTNGDLPPTEFPSDEFPDPDQKPEFEGTDEDED